MSKHNDDCAVRNGVGDWTVHQYGYERYVVLNERGHEVAATHQLDTARLISAAPELLEALRGFVECDEPSCEHYAAASAAIAKAEGRP